MTNSLDIRISMHNDFGLDFVLVFFFLNIGILHSPVLWDFTFKILNIKIIKLFIV